MPSSNHKMKIPLGVQTITTIDDGGFLFLPTVSFSFHAYVLSLEVCHSTSRTSVVVNPPQTGYVWIQSISVDLQFDTHGHTFILSNSILLYHVLPTQ